MSIVKDEINDMLRENLELSILALTGDVVSFGKLGENLLKSPFEIKNIIYYQNFQKFIEGIGYNSDIQKKFLEFLNEGDKEYKTKKILLTLDEIDSDFKEDCIINLTKSVGYKFINSRYYMKLCSIVTDMLTEDLIHLKKIIKEGSINDELNDEYERNGLMYFDNSRNHVFSKMAFDLDKYALSYATDKYNYSMDEIRIYPDRFHPNVIFSQDEEPQNIQNGDVWLKTQKANRDE